MSNRAAIAYRDGSVAIFRDFLQNEWPMSLTPAVPRRPQCRFRTQCVDDESTKGSPICYGSNMHHAHSQANGVSPAVRERARPVLVPPVAFDQDGYPHSDGSALFGEHQARTLFNTVVMLWTAHDGQLDAVVAGDMFVYDREGDPQPVAAPDVLVSFGVRVGEDERTSGVRRKRNSYKFWEEGKPPDFVLEVLSPTTWVVDVGDKRELYANLGIAEYWLFDPFDKYLEDGPLVGLRLRKGFYEPIPALPDGSIPSAVLGLELRPNGDEVRLRDPKTGRELMAHREAVAAYEQAEAARKRAEADCQQAIADCQRERVRRLRAETSRDRERAARQQAEKRLAELQASIRNLRGRG